MSHPGPDTRLVRKAAIRLGAQAAALVAVTVIALIALSTAVVLHAQHTATENLLHAAVATADDVVDPPSDVWLTISQGNQEQSSAGLPPGLPDRPDLSSVNATGHTIEHDLETHGRHFRILTTTTEAGTVQASLDLRADHAEQGRLLSALLAGGLAGLLLAILVGTMLGRRAVRPLSDALALQRRFVADASHELRTPLTLLSTRAQLVASALSKAGADSTVRADADGVVSDAGHLADIVEDLLAAADPRAATAPVDLGELLNAVAASTAAYAADHHVSLTVLPIQETVVALGQEAGLRRALTALVDNAVHHSPPTGTVTLALRIGSRRTAELSVSDEGPGVDPGRRDELVRRFHSEAGAAGGRRYGLGLALADEIASRHGGRLDITPGPSGRGSSFIVTLPVRSVT